MRGWAASEPSTPPFALPQSKPSWSLLGASLSPDDDVPPLGIFSPDGERIIILAAGGIYEMNADGTNLQKLDPIGDHGGLDWGQR